MFQIDKDHPPSVGPIGQRYKWCCNNGCGECTPVLVEFRTYHSTLNGATDQERTEPRMVSRCCGEGMFLWDTTLDDDGPMGYDGALAGPPQKTQQPAPSTAPAFQQRVQPWLLECFGAEIAADRVERNHRFLEESLELVQALGCTASEAHQLVDYVFSRPVGDPPQEVGGVMVTLAALCLANSLDMHDAGEVELERISAPELVAKIRAKQAAKPKHSPLPESAAPQADSQPAPPTAYPTLPEPSTTGLGDEYEAYDRTGRAMGKAYETILYFKADQMRAYVDADREARKQGGV